jgi:micrococcal nuclease
VAARLVVIAAGAALAASCSSAPDPPASAPPPSRAAAAVTESPATPTSRRPVPATAAPTIAPRATPTTIAPRVARDGPYRVVRVVDGDTVTVANGDTLRLIGIDTPETVDPREPVQCFGVEASRRAHVLLDGRSVELEYDATQGTLDRYGRTLAYVWLPDGRLFNEVMIAEGFAHEYTYDVPYRYQARFRAAQHAARDAQRGLWSPSTCGGDTSGPARAPDPAAGARAGCDPSYPSVCIPPPPPDLDCADISARAFTVTGADPHRFDGDHDGRGCEG